jgi:hypothetical protein
MVRMGSTRSAKAYYQHIQPQEIYTQGHAPMYGRMGSTRCCAALLPAACAAREKYNPGTWHSSMYISNGIHTTALRLPPAAPTREKYTPVDMAFLHVYIRMGSTRCSAATRLPAWKPQGKILHLGRHSSMYKATMGIYTVPPPATTSSLCHKEKYTPGHSISPCIYQNGIYTVQTTYQQLVPQGRNIHQDMVYVYIRMGSTRKALRLLLAASHKGEKFGHGEPMYISEWDLHGSAATTTSSPA